jgi:hypothetical protein
MIINNIIPFFSQHQKSKKFLFFIKNTFSQREYCFIRDIIYSIQKKHGLVSQGKRWIYNTAAAWGKRYDCHERTIERMVKKLREEEIIQVKHLYPIRSVRTNCYRINEEKLSEKFLSWQEEEKIKAKQVRSLMASPFQGLNKKQNVGMKATPNYLRNKSTLFQRENFQKKPFSRLSTLVYDCEHMLNEWNYGYLIPQGKMGQQMNKEVARLFNAAKKICGLTKQKWSDLVDALRRNEWFNKTAREKGWKISLKEILRFKVLKRLLEGGYGIGNIDKSFGLPEDVKIKLSKVRPGRAKMKQEIVGYSFKNMHFEEIERDPALMELAENGGWAKAILGLPSVRKEFPKPQEPERSMPYTASKDIEIITYGLSNKLKVEYQEFAEDAQTKIARWRAALGG